MIEKDISLKICCIRGGSMGNAGGAGRWAAGSITSLGGFARPTLPSLTYLLRPCTHLLYVIEFSEKKVNCF